MPEDQIKIDLAARRAPRAPAFTPAQITLLYAGTLFTSAALLFWLQPMFTKMVLPLFGGAPAVWTTAAMFFQLLLLAGYLYAHGVSQLRSTRLQIGVHVGLLVLAFGALPVAVNPQWVTASEGPPIVVLLVTLSLGVGLPFLALAATAPLLQSWFSRTRHQHAADPYFLYSASNLGSVVALIAYPALIEILLGLTQQSRVWSLGYAVLAALIGICAVNACRWPRQDTAPLTRATPSAAPVNWRQRMQWMILAFVPSSLLLGVTQHISTEIASIPLLWIIPLLLYTLTYVNAFARRTLLSQAWILKAQPLAAIALALTWTLNTHLSVFLVHLAVFFVTALMCHGELALRRPSATHLTDFYLCIAVGGALGGAFNAIAAPLIFNSVLEYPIVIGLACMLRPPSGMRRAWPAWTAVASLVGLVLAFGLCVATDFRPFERGAVATIVYLEVIGLALYLTHTRPVAFGLAMMVVLLGSPILHSGDEKLVRHRSFFGVHTVLLDQTRKFHVLMHGITVHGAQYLAPEKRREPTTYFHRDSPLGQMFHALGANDRFRQIGVIGLGVGTTACYRKPGQDWTFFEIDPTVVALATDRRYFSFLADCAPDAKIVMGDGRLSLKAVADRRFDLIIIDTFSSDAIPMHMITREALALYLSKLRPGGVVMFHISNQHLALTPVLANLAQAAGLAGMMPGPHLSLPPEDRFGQLDSDWVAIAREPRDLAALESEEGWVKLAATPRARLWTDDYSNILGALK
jgi:hypothetical protein